VTRAGAPALRLLEELQQDLPLVERPFAGIGRRCGMSEAEVIETTRTFLSQGLVREISALLDGRRLGFRSALVAVRAAGSVESLTGRINPHPGVSHNYLRDHPWNLWFTLAVPEERDLAAEVEGLLGCGAPPFMILPAVRTFKLRVHLRFAEPGRPGGDKQSVSPASEAEGSPALSPFHRQLLGRLEEPLPVIPRPWEAVAAALDASQEEVMTAVDALKRSGIIRRVAAVLRHRSVGYAANAMVCLRLPEGRVAEAGERAARLSWVSHCYQRESRPEWPYALYAMVHARSREQCDGLVGNLAEVVEAEGLQVLYSQRELKKRRIKYFGGMP